MYRGQRIILARVEFLGAGYRVLLRCVLLLVKRRRESEEKEGERRVEERSMDQKKKKEGTRTANEEERQSPQWRPVCNVELRCLCTTGVGCRYCGDRPWHSYRQKAQTLGPCLLLRQRLLGKGNCLAWLLSSLLSFFYLLYSSLPVCASNRMHKYAIAAAMTRILRDPIGRWVRDGFNNKDEGGQPHEAVFLVK